MAEHDQDQKTEQPTEKHLSDARDRGQFAKAPELSVLLMVGSAVAVLAFTARSSAQAVGEFAVSIFTRFTVTSVQRDTVVVELGEMVMVVARALGPVLAACVVAALLAGGLQSGFQLSPKALAIRWEALDPASGFGRIFSKAVLVRAGIDLLKLIAIGCALYVGARNLLLDPLFSAPVEAAYLGQFLNQAAIAFLSRLLLALGVIAAISYAYEKFKLSRELMMTRDQVKEERRNAEGNANLKAAQRRLARRLVQKQMLAAVPTADVIVTNPTHFAVALKYERGVDQAPVVLAKGENRFAQRLKAIAAEHGVPTIENKPVARLLFAMGRVGETIPPQLYQAVAEILAVVYRTHRYYFHQLRTRRLAGAA
ncbi:MAG: EscU/YscU/HrcU family type III secretion system export apparatus switch protein [Opitutaceae bacterium]|nr:EscU/YscU/HrcU family type III secretion system export apparatus switch protein [Opitutaceae bacterium]